MQNHIKIIKFTNALQPCDHCGLIKGSQRRQIILEIGYASRNAATPEQMQLGITCLSRIMQPLTGFPLTGNPWKAVTRLDMWLERNPVTREQFMQLMADEQRERDSA